MPTLTLSALRAKIRRLGNYENSTVVTPTFIDEHINEALEAYHKIVVDKYEGHYDKVDDTLVSVAGTQTINLPADFLRQRMIERKIGTDEFVEIRKITLIETRRHQGRGTPVAYQLFGGALPGTLRLWPVPDGVYTFRLTYIPKAAQLAADGDSFAFLPQGDVFVVNRVLFECDSRDERASAADRWARAEAAEKALSTEAEERDVGEPEYLIPRGGSWSEED